MKDSSLGFVLSLPYRDFENIFGDNTTPKYTDILNELPSRAVLLVASFLTSKIHGKESNFDTQFDILKHWIGRFPTELVKKIIFRFQYEKNDVNDVVIFNNTTNLILTQYALEHFVEGDIEELSAEQELLFLKAYLLINEEWIDRIYSNIELPEKNSEDIDIAKLILPTYLPYAEINKSRRIGSQIIKGIQFFKFLENNNQLDDLLP